MQLREVDYESLAVFAELKQDNIQAMLTCLGAYTKEISAGEFIFLEEEAVNYVGFILSGGVHMIKEDENGDKSILLYIGAGSLFGESYGIPAYNVSAVSFKAGRDCHILFMPFHKVFHLCNPKCKFHNKLIQNITKLMAEKNAKLIQKVEIMTKKGLREKVMTYLRMEEEGRIGEPFEIPFGRVELAEFLAADRSALTRELGNMKKAGLIDFDKNRFRIL